MANRIAQLRNGALFQRRLGGDAAAAGGAVDQQFGDQSVACLTTGLALRFVILDQALQLGTRTLQQQGQAFVQASFAIFRWRHAVEGHQGMQAEASQGFAPFTFAMAGAGDEIEHRQQRPAAHGQHRQFVAVLGQHRLTHINHIQAGVGGHELAQHLGFLLVTLARFAAFEKAGQACRAVQALAGAVEALQVVEQGDGVFQAGVSYSSSNAWPSTDRRAPSTWRVVLARGETSPNSTSRVRVRSSEVLPTLVWPTRASFSGALMAWSRPGSPEAERALR